MIYKCFYKHLKTPKYAKITMKKIILDTNFLMAVSQFNIDIFKELERICDFNYELYVLEGTKEELEKLIKELSLSKKVAAKIALSLIERTDINIILHKKGHVDDILAEQDAIIATQDKELKQKLKAKDIKTITIRQKKHLILE